ncbi:hypothetical protein [Taibaiella koreensis]|uniref:hypothetical protein n=1 Tax=Taibaiella koreensis TaxID=1268548 RepID=UPI0013C32B7C|nr:hypothetical protein [Taibaiella koreensis]
MNPIDHLPYIIDRVQQAGLRYELHTFPSGAAMVDIWIEDRFYVVQIDDRIIGLSLVTDDTTWFDIIPDQSFTDPLLFQQAFEAIF